MGTCLVSSFTFGTVSNLLKPVQSSSKAIKTDNTLARIGSINIVSNKFKNKELIKKILEIIPLKLRGAFNKTELEFSKNQILSAYKMVYPSSSINVTPLLKTNKNGLMDIVFKVNIEEIKISNVIVKGNKLLSSRKIASLLARKPSGMSIPYLQKNVIDITELSNSADLIKAYAFSIGLFDFNIVSIYYEQEEDNPSSITVVIEIQEGDQYKFGEAKYTNKSPIVEIDRIINRNIKPGLPYDRSRISYVVARISEILIRKNLNNYIVKIKENKDKNSRISIDFEIIETEQNRILKSISIKGNFTTPDDVIMQKLKLRKGDPVSFEAIKDQEKLLFETGLFKRVEVNAVLTKQNEVDLVLSVEESDTKIYIGGSLKGDILGVEGSVKIPGFYETGTILSASAYISQSPSLQVTISEKNAFGLGLDLDAEIGVSRFYRGSSLFGYPETISEFIGYLFSDKWHINNKRFVKDIKDSVEKNPSLDIFEMPESVILNWKENYFVEMLENLIKAKFSIAVPGKSSFVFSVFSNFRMFENQYYPVPNHLEKEIEKDKKKKEEIENKTNKTNDYQDNNYNVNKENNLDKDFDKDFQKIMDQNIDRESKSIRLFKDFMIKNKYEIGGSLKYIFSDSNMNTNYSYGSEIIALTGTTSAIKINIFYLLSQPLNENALFEIEGNLGLALCDSFIDNFTSEVNGLKYGPIELYRFTFLGGCKAFNVSTRLFLNIFKSDTVSLTLKNSLSINSIWDSGIYKNRLPKKLCAKRGWSTNSVDIAMDDFSPVVFGSIGLITKLSGLIVPGSGFLVFSASLNKPLTENQLIRYSPIDISFGFSNN